MPSDKLTRILRAKSPFTEEQIESMPETVGWDWVYANAKPTKEKLTQVCFTGFAAAEKQELERLAEESHLEVVTSVTKNLAFLCAGPNAGPAKLTKATEQGVQVLSKQQLLQLLETGAISGA